MNRHRHTFDPPSPQVTYTVQTLARDVLSMAASAGMPGSYWHTDQRILRAATVLGLTPDEAREQALNIEWDDDEAG